MATYDSDLYASQLRASADAKDFSNVSRHLRTTFTLDALKGHAAGQHTLRLGIIPYHYVIVSPHLSVFASSAMTTAAVVNLGFRYVNPDTDAVVADDNFWLSAVVVTSAINATLFPSVAGVAAGGLALAANEFRTKDGLHIEALIATANMRLGDWVAIDMAYSILR